MQFTGGKEMADALRDLSKRMTRNVMIEALIDAAEPARQRMAQLAPREPGAPDIAENIVVSQVKARAPEYAVGIGPARGFFYGFFQEFGTVHHAAQPFMRPAFDTMHPQCLQRLKLSFWAAMTKRGFGRARSSSGTGTL